VKAFKDRLPDKVIRHANPANPLSFPYECLIMFFFLSLVPMARHDDDEFLDPFRGHFSPTLARAINLTCL
jgi:hypothetical protein